MVTCFPTRRHPPLTKQNKTFQPFIVLSRDSVFFCHPVDEILINNVLIQLICCKEWQLQVLCVPDRPENDKDVITPRTDDPLSPSQIPVASCGFLQYHTHCFNYPTTLPSPNLFHHSSKSGFHNKIHRNPYFPNGAQSSQPLFHLVSRR